MIYHPAKKMEQSPSGKKEYEYLTDLKIQLIIRFIGDFIFAGFTSLSIMHEERRALTLHFI